MRHIQTPGGKVCFLQFGMPRIGLYVLAKGRDGKERGFDLITSAFRIDPSTGVMQGSWEFGGSEAAAFTPDCSSVYHSVSVAVAGGELDLRRVDLLTGKQEQIYDSNVPYPGSFSFSPNGHTLAIGGQHYAGDGEYYVHRLDVWHKVELDPIRTEVYCLGYSPDGRMLASGNSATPYRPQAGIRIWSGKRLVEEFAAPAHHLAWSSDGQLAWGISEQLNIARPGTKEPVRSWSNSTGRLSALNLSPNCRLLLTGTNNGLCVLHDTLAGQQPAVFDWDIGPIHSVAFSPDGLTCAAGGENGQIVIWDVDE